MYAYYSIPSTPPSKPTVSRSAPPVSTVVTAASQWQPAVTDEVSASELCWKWSRMKSQLLSSGWRRTPWVLKSKSQLPEQPKKKYLNTSKITAVERARRAAAGGGAAPALLDRRRRADARLLARAAGRPVSHAPCARPSRDHGVPMARDDSTGRLTT